MAYTKTKRENLRKLGNLTGEKSGNPATRPCVLNLYLLFQSEATERKHDYFYTTKPKVDDKRARHVNPMYYGSQYIK